MNLGAIYSTLEIDLRRTRIQKMTNWIPWKFERRNTLVPWQLLNWLSISWTAIIFITNLGVTMSADLPSNENFYTRSISDLPERGPMFGEEIMVPCGRQITAHESSSFRQVHLEPSEMGHLVISPPFTFVDDSICSKIDLPSPTRPIYYLTRVIVGREVC